jgi:hypothetical protein
LDAALCDEHAIGPATSSYEHIMAKWNCFKQFADELDRTLFDPFAPGAPQVLSRGMALVGIEIDKLAGWLSHVGEALMGSGQGPPAPTAFSPKDFDNQF